MEKNICKYMIHHGIFDTMIKYRKNYQQLGVIFRRIYGIPFTQYCNENKINIPKTKLNWQEKTKLICDTFQQQVIKYSSDRRTRNPIMLKCLICDRTYETKWQMFNSGQICSCAITHQRNVVDINYYIKHFLQNNWEILNESSYENSHSVLKMRHSCGYIKKAMAKTLKQQKGNCKCQHQNFDIDYYTQHFLQNNWEILNANSYENRRSVLEMRHSCGYTKKAMAISLKKQKGHCSKCEYNPTQNKRVKIKPLPLEIRNKMSSLGMTGYQISSINKQIHSLQGEIINLFDDHITVNVHGEHKQIMLFPTHKERITQKLYNYNIPRYLIRHMIRSAAKNNYDIIDIDDENIILKHNCGQIHSQNRHKRINYNPICPCQAHDIFFKEIQSYPLQKTFNERWSLIEFNGKMKPITIKCKKCKAIKIVKRLYSFTYQVRCGCEDTISYGERIIFNLLNHNNINFERQYILDNKRFDFHLPDYKLLLEYDGIQHTKDVPWWGTTHESQIENDHHKNLIAEKHNYSLVRFPHTYSVDDIIEKLKPYITLIKKTNFDYNRPVTLLPDEIIDDYLTMTYQQLKEKYSGYGYSLSTSRLNKEFKLKYGKTKIEILSNQLSDIGVIEDFKTMNYLQLREKYPEIAHLITHDRLRRIFRSTYGMSKLEYRRKH